MNYEEKIDEAMDINQPYVLIRLKLIALLEKAYAEGFMDCMNKMMAYVKIETEKEKVN